MGALHHLLGIRRPLAPQSPDREEIEAERGVYDTDLRYMTDAQVTAMALAEIMRVLDSPDEVLIEELERRAVKGIYEERKK